MDHLIEQIINYMDCDVERLRDEYECTGVKLKECPSYSLVKCYCDAIKALNKMDGGYNAYTTPSGRLRQRGVKI